MATFSLNERITARYTATVKDETGIAIPAASLTTLTLTLYNRADGSIINSRNAQDVLNANNVTVDSAGLITWTMQPADNPIVDDTREIERHVALWVWTYSSGTKTGRHETEFDVENFAKVA